MISKQINFFHSSSDVNKFIDFFKENNYALYPYKIANLDEVKGVDLTTQKRIEVIYDETKVHFDFIQKQGYYLFNPERSYAVEFLLSSELQGNKIGAGRLYYTAKYYENGQFTFKDDEFVKDANNLFKKFKKQFLKKTKNSHNWYLTGDIIGLFEQNIAEWEQNYNVINCIVARSPQTS